MTNHIVYCKKKKLINNNIMLPKPGAILANKFMDFFRE